MAAPLSTLFAADAAPACTFRGRRVEKRVGMSFSEGPPSVPSPCTTNAWEPLQAAWAAGDAGVGSAMNRFAFGIQKKGCVCEDTSKQRRKYDELACLLVKIQKT
jgi:hypothetical protein